MSNEKSNGNDILKLIKTNIDLLNTIVNKHETKMDFLLKRMQDDFTAYATYFTEVKKDFTILRERVMTIEEKVEGHIKKTSH